MGDGCLPMIKLNPPEKVIQLQILKYPQFIGAKAGKTKTMGVKRGKFFCLDPYTFRGHPDILCFWKNEIWYIEVKNKTGKLSPHQETFRLLCNESNTHYILARSLEDVSEVIC